MTEKIHFWQNKDFQVQFQAADPRQPESGEMNPVQGLHEITPYGMMLFSLAGCTAQVVLSYASHHGIDLDAVEMELTYERDHQKDCENCEEIDRYREHITGDIRFNGDLDQEQRQKLLRISRQCPIEKMFAEGIPITIQLDQPEKA